MTLTTVNSPGGTFPLTITATSGALSHQASASLTVAGPVSLALPIRVNTGGPGYTDAFGQAWLADTGYLQGGAYSTVANISGTPDPALYRDEHYSASGPLTYQFAVPNGSYTVNLKFAEIYYTSPGQRVFDVAINGTTVFPHLDIIGVTGAANKALDLSFPATVSGGVLTLTFTGITGLPKINAIEILQGTAPASLRVNAGGPAYTDVLGQSWAADSGFGSGGGSYSTVAPITGTADPTLYQTEHYSLGSTLVYQAAVPNGNHIVNLKFAEIYYTSAGQRVFNVGINGVTVQPNFDIFAAAGGANRAIDLSYPVVVSGGQVTVTLTAVTGLTKVNAIEIR